MLSEPHIRHHNKIKKVFSALNAVFYEEIQKTFELMTTGNGMDNFPQILQVVSNSIVNNDKDALKNVLDMHKARIGEILNPEICGYYFLHEACETGLENIVLILLQYGAFNCLEVSSVQGTPLKLACDNGHDDIVHTLLDQGAKLHDPVISEMSPLYAAVINGHCSIIDVITVKACRHVVVYGYPNINVLLYGACLYGHMNIVSKLLEAEIDINAKLPLNRIPYIDACNTNNYTALYAAMTGGHIDIAEKLIRNGAVISQNIVDDLQEVSSHVLQRFVTSDINSECEGASVCWNNLKISAVTIPNLWIEELLMVNHLVTIDLSGNKIQELPSSLPWSMGSLEECNISKNNLNKMMPPSEVHCRKLRVLNLSRNLQLPSVPVEVFQLPNLEVLNLSYNSLCMLHHDVDSDCRESWSSIKTWPGSLSDPYQERSQSHNSASEYLTSWKCKNLKILDISHNRLSNIPFEIRQTQSLTRLNASHNLLTDFPAAWSCPLEMLNLSGNMLKNFAKNVDMFWSSSLKYLFLNRNQITELPETACRLSMLNELQISHNSLTCLPLAQWWTCKKLEKLDFKGNCLGNPEIYEELKKVEEQGYKEKVKAAFDRLKPKPKNKSDDKQTQHNEKLQLPNSICHSLKSISLRSNYLYEVPEIVFSLRNLEEIDLRDNMIRSLPLELGRLSLKCRLKVDIKAVDPSFGISENDIQKGAQQLMMKLRANLRDSQEFYRMKLVVVGKENRGKTTLLEILRMNEKNSKSTLKSPPISITTTGVKISDLVLRGHKQGDPHIEFSCWDMAGQSDYYVTHQCFLSRNALYLVVWNVALQMEGIENIRTWLLNIQARAPDSSIIIVGTHLDRLDLTKKNSIIAKLDKAIMEKYVQPGYPLIKAIEYVSCINKLENIDYLRARIYNIAENMFDSTNSKQQLIGRLVPKSYLELEKIILNQRQLRKNNNQSTVLLGAEFDQLIQQIPAEFNDIDSEEEKSNAVQFLHEIGLILHYRDQHRALNALYFIEPSWLCDVLARVINIKAIASHINNGMIKQSDFDMCLKECEDDILPGTLIDKYIHLLERFDIALQLDNGRLFIPAKLSESRFGFDCSDNYSDVDRPVMYRWYKMSYIPSGFWSRLITRLIVGVHQQLHHLGIHSKGRTLSKKEKRKRQTSNLKNLSQWSLKRRNIIGTSLLFNNTKSDIPESFIETEYDKMFFWQKGILVCYNGGHFIVESSSDHFSADVDDNQGILVSVFSKDYNFSAVGFLADQIDTLILEWFPGLLGLGRHKPLLQIVIPCPMCIIQQPDPQKVQIIASVPFFSYEDCAIALIDGHKNMLCKEKHEDAIQLSQLVPDLVLADLPSHFHVDENVKITPQLIDDNLLGKGAAAKVYKANYKRKLVAVKLLHGGGEISDSQTSSSGSHESEDSSTDEASCNSILSHHLPNLRDDCKKEERGLKIIKALKSLRQEVMLMARLHNPNIIALIAASVKPPCLIIEYAPLGSLRSVLDKNIAEHQNKFRSNRQMYPSVLGRLLSYKISLQVALALKYLHKKDIIYRDLKSENILVFSLAADEPINIKLSDYGISRYNTPQGIIGNDGTAGFIAPEIETGVAHDQQIDIFSYSMFLYELLSGHLPFEQHHHSCDVSKALKSGERPKLKEVNVDIQMPFLEDMMEKCWHARPEKRPSSAAIADAMEEPQFLSLKRTEPTSDRMAVINELDCLQVPTKETNNQLVWIWGGKDKKRVYHIFDNKHGLYHLYSQSNPGPKTTFSIRIGKSIWLGNESKEIEIYGYPKIGLLQLEEKLYMEATPLCICHEVVSDEEENLESFIYGKHEYKQRVYVGTDSGTVVIYGSKNEGQKNLLPNKRRNQIYCSVQSAETQKIQWNPITTLFLNDRNNISTYFTCSCMEHVRSQNEIWVGSGNSISVISTKTCKIEGENIQLLKIDSNIVDMVSCDKRVWCYQEKSCRVLQYCAASRQLTHIFDCYCDKVGEVIVNHFSSGVGDTAQSPLPDTYDSQSDTKEDSELFQYDILASIASSSEGNASTSRQSSDVNIEFVDKFMTSLASKSDLEDGTEPLSTHSPLQFFGRKHKRELAKNILDKMPLLQDFNDTDSSIDYGNLRDDTYRNKSQSSPHISTNSLSSADSILDVKMRGERSFTDIRQRKSKSLVQSHLSNVRCVAIVKDTLWIGKENGKISIVDLRERDTFGSVVASFCSKPLIDIKETVVKLMLMGSEHVVAVKKYSSLQSNADLPQSFYQLCIWEAYACHDMFKVKGISQHLREENKGYNDSSD